MQDLRSTPDLLGQNLHFYKMPKGFICIVKTKKQCSRLPRIIGIQENIFRNMTVAKNKLFVFDLLTLWDRHLLISIIPCNSSHGNLFNTEVREKIMNE